MSLIVWRGGVLAADSYIGSPDVWMASTSKIRFLGRGFRHPLAAELRDLSVWAGAAGKLADVEAFMAWMAGNLYGRAPSRSGVHENPLQAIVAYSNGDAFLCDEQRALTLIKDPPFTAAGRRWEFAYGCLAAGQSARRAIETTARYCAHVRLPCETVNTIIPADAGTMISRRQLLRLPAEHGYN